MSGCALGYEEGVRRAARYVERCGVSPAGEFFIEQANRPRDGSGMYVARNASAAPRASEKAPEPADHKYLLDKAEHHRTPLLRQQTHRAGGSVSRCAASWAPLRH
jgi:hypothetical protein